MFGQTFLTAAAPNIYFSIFSINNSELFMFISLAIYKDVYTACRTGGDESEFSIVLLLLLFGSMEVGGDCLVL